MCRGATELLGFRICDFLFVCFCVTVVVFFFLTFSRFAYMLIYVTKFGTKCMMRQTYVNMCEYVNCKQHPENIFRNTCTSYAREAALFSFPCIKHISETFFSFCYTR